MRFSHTDLILSDCHTQNCKKCEVIRKRQPGYQAVALADRLAKRAVNALIKIVILKFHFGPVSPDIPQQNFTSSKKYMDGKFVSADRAGYITFAPLFGKPQILLAIWTHSEPVRFEILDPQALPFKPTLHFSDIIGVIRPDEQTVEPISLTTSFLNIFRQHTEHRKTENRKRRKIENVICDTVAHKRSDTVEQKI